MIIENHDKATPFLYILSLVIGLHSSQDLGATVGDHVATNVLLDEVASILSETDLELRIFVKPLTAVWTVFIAFGIWELLLFTGEFFNKARA